MTKELPYNLQQQQSLRLIFQLVQGAFTPTRTTVAALSLILRPVVVVASNSFSVYQFGTAFNINKSAFN